MNRQEIKQKLIKQGYYPQDLEDKIAELNKMMDWNAYTEKQVELQCYEKPSQEIPKFYCDRSWEKIFILDGEINFEETTLLEHETFTFADFKLGYNLCLVGVSKEKKMKILLYLPNEKTMIQYMNATYEGLYAEERKKYIELCKNSLLSQKTMTEDKAKEIISMLISDFVIDSMIINNLSPKWKLYHNIEKFAQTITNYQYEYINKMENRVEKIEKNITVKALGKGVKIGNSSNEPYLALKESNQIADFPLNSPSYVWFSTASKKGEELAIYTAKEKYTVQTYREWLEEKGDPLLKEEAEKLKLRFSKEIGYPVSFEYILKCLKKLNRELVIFPMDFLKHQKLNLFDEIEPIKYRYKALTNPEAFEKMLYNALEEDFNGRYKYRLVEKVSGLYTLIGNKFSNRIEEQTQADFNQNANAAIVKKETFLSQEIASQIRTYGMDKNKTDSLPVPILDVIFYFPEKEILSEEVKMYHGSNVEDIFNYVKESEREVGREEEVVENENALQQDKQENQKEKDEMERYYVMLNTSSKSNNKIDEDKKNSININDTTLMNSKKKESEVFPNNETQSIETQSIETQSIETQSAETQSAETQFAETKEEIKSPQMQIVRIQYKDDLGNLIEDEKIQKAKVGEKIIFTEEDHYIDSLGRHWKAASDNETYRIISEKEEENRIVLQYSPVLENVIITFQDEEGNELKNRKVIQVQLGTTFQYLQSKSIKDKKGNEWKLLEKEYKPLLVTEDEKENVINYIYEVAKAQVIIKYLKRNGEELFPEEHLIKQVGSGMVSTPQPLVYDKENKGWKLSKVQPAMLKVANENNVITIVYEEAMGKVIWKYLDIYGNELKPEEVQRVQIGLKYSPLVKDRVIYKSEEVWKLMEIKPYEIIVSENEKENIIELIYSNAK